MIDLNRQSWNGTTYSDGASWGTGAAIPISASDTLVAALVEAPTVAYLVSTDDTATVGAGEVGTVLAPTLKSASDVLTPVISSSYSIASSGGVTPIASSDALVVGLVEAPTVAYLVSTDDAVLVGTGEVGTANSLMKSAADSLVVGLSESYSLVGSNAGTPTAFDTLVLSIIETSSLAVTVSKSASDTLTPGITEASLVTPSFVVTSSDTLTVGLSESRSVAHFDAPKIGLLPPGWIERELEELAGIARPWRVEPGNVTPHQGWKKRSYWAVYDEHGNLRATDRWQGAARAQAWTQYQSGKLAA